MASLDPLAAVLALADVNVELPQDGLAGDLGLILVDDFGLNETTAAAGTGVGKGRFVVFLDLVGRGWRPMPVSAVRRAAFPSGASGVDLGIASAKGGGLAFAGAARFVELAGEFLDLVLEIGDAPLQDLTFRAAQCAHTPL